MKYTKKQIAQSVQAFAPAGTQLPDFIVKAASRKPRAPAKREEETLQRQCCQWLALQKDVLYFSIPNHLWLGRGDKGKQAAYIARQKTQGFLPGVSDLVIILKGPRIVFCELKAAKGVVSDSQENFQFKAKSLGCKAAIVRSFDEFVAMIKPLLT